jgi:type I restriction enzyme S subunit
MTTTIKKKLPALRFPEFEGEWEEKQLGEVFTFLPTNSFSRALLNNQEGVVKNIHYGDIHTRFRSSFDVLKEEVPYVNQEVDLKKIPKENYCKVGDLIVADASEDYKDVGKAIEIVNLCDQKVISGLHTLMLRDEKNKTAIGFKGYLMQSHPVRLQIMKMATGISVLGISKGNLSKVKLPFPSLPEQQKIASFLSAVDTRIQQLTRKKALLEQYKKGVMQQIFSRQIRFKDDQEKEFSEWEEKRLGEVATFFSGGTPPTTNTAFYTGNIPFIKSGEINADITEQFISEDGLKNSSAKKVQKGDLLYALYGATSGEVGIAKLNGAINQAVLCIRSSQLTYFLYLFLQFNKTKIINTYLQGGQGNLSAHIVRSLKISLPSLPEQQKIASFLSALDVKIDQVAKQLAQMQTFKKGLLQQMFV